VSCLIKINIDYYFFYNENGPAGAGHFARTNKVAIYLSVLLLVVQLLLLIGSLLLPRLRPQPSSAGGWDAQMPRAYERTHTQCLCLCPCAPQTG
jgi:hypothetical protein